MFYNLSNSGVNSEAIAYYEYDPAGADRVPGGAEPRYARLRLVLMVNGAMLDLEGAEAETLYEQLRVKASPADIDRQNALDSLKAFFFADPFNSPSWTAAQEAYSVLARAKLE